MSIFKPVKIRGGRDNFFTPIRLFLAVTVMIGHAFYVTKGHLFSAGPLAEPMVFFEYRPSYLAVNLFFILSGFLITKSLLGNRNIAEYAAARILRIFPALIIYMLFVMFVMGPLVTSLPMAEFFSHREFLNQPMKVLTFYRTQMVLPGAFENNSAQVSSATLWTLRYEALAYIGTAMAFCMGLMKRNWMILGQCLAFLILWPLAHATGLFDEIMGTFQRILRLGVCYSIGAAIYAYREKLSFHVVGIPVLGCASVALHNTVFFEIMVDVWMAYTLFWAAYVTMPKLVPLQNISDISYGIYVFHYAILQWAFHINTEISTLGLIAVTAPVSIVLGIISWHYVEKTALARRKILANGFHSIARELPLYIRRLLHPKKTISHKV